MNALEGAAVSAASNSNAVTAQPQAQAQIVPPNTQAVADPALAEQARQIAALQGLGKQVAPSVRLNNMAKRDIAGFDRALRYAEAALTKGPDIQLGTGAEGSGVGIIIDNNPTAGMFSC